MQPDSTPFVDQQHVSGPTFDPSAQLETSVGMPNTNHSDHRPASAGTIPPNTIPPAGKDNNQPLFPVLFPDRLHIADPTHTNGSNGTPTDLPPSRVLPSPTESPLDNAFMSKLLKDSLTSHWCIKSGESCCFAQLKNQPADGPKVVRYTCASCVKANPTGTIEWKASTTQVNLVKKHSASSAHFTAFQEMFPISDDAKRKRILEVIPSLRHVLQAHSDHLQALLPNQKPKPDPKFIEADLRQLQIDVITNPSGAYWRAYSFGMGSAAGTRGAGLPPKSKRQFTPTPHPPIRTNSPHQHQQHFQAAPTHRPPDLRHPPDLTNMPLTLSPDMARMYQNAAARTQDFHTKTNASV